MSKYYSRHEFSKIIGVSAQTLRNWDANGKLHPHHTTVSGYRYYSDEQLNQVIRDQMIFYLGKLPEILIENSKIFEYAFEEDESILVKISAATVIINHDLNFDIEKKYIDYILNDENWEKTLRSWVVVFWQDVIYDDPYSYMDKGGNWNNIKQRRIGRLQMKNTEDNIKYMRTRAIDLAQLYIFYRNRGWNTLDQKNYNAIINCDTELECYSIQKKELLKKLKEMFKDATLGLFS